MESTQNRQVLKDTSEMDLMLEMSRAVQATLENKSLLIDNMAYQIRTLSNAIIGFSDLLNAEDLEEGLKDYVSEIHQAGKAMSNLVNDVLDVVKLDSGKLTITKNHCNLSERLNELHENVGVAARQKGLAFSIVADKTVPEQIFTDGDRLMKCLINLIANAIKYTKQGFVQVSVSIVEKKGTSWFQFNIKDSGQGISSDRLPRIFDEVAKPQNANCGVLSNMDMGLSFAGSLPITKRLVTALDGIVEVSSVVGSGSTFSLLLPAAKSAENGKKLNLSNGPQDKDLTTKAASTSQKPTKNAKPESNKGHVLLVEDQESNRTVATLLLQTLGLKVTSVEDGQAAVEKATTEVFDLIFMDLMLPKMNGYEATRILRSKNIHIPIIALSAGVLNEDEARCIAENFNEMLSKPVDVRKLRQVMQTYLPNFESATSNTGKAKNTDNEEFTIEYTH